MRKIAQILQYTMLCSLFTQETNPTFKDNSVSSSLTIQNFQPEDEGRYYCNAMNEQGQRQREFTVKGIVCSKLSSFQIASL